MNHRQGGFGAGVGVTAAIIIGTDVGQMAVVGYGIGILVDDIGRVVRDRLEDAGDEVDAAHAAYVNDEIDEAELERRLDLALDPETERIRAAVTPVNGVGPATAAALHQEFGTLDAIERADVDTLAHAHGVGPSTAEKIRERFR